jgi:DNA-binding NarL/FixJ family response regulator
MIVEDEPLTASHLREVVLRRGLGVEGPFSSAEEAVRALATRAPAAALLDVSLADGGTSGPVASALAEAGVPFAFVTGYGPETNEVVRAYPRSLVIPKPCDDETLDMLLDELISKAG